jgi:HK97 family phage major capsid protein
MTRLLGGGGGSPADGGEALQSEYKALGEFFRTGDDAELKGMSVGDDPSGGFLVTPALSNELTKRLFDATPIRRLARIVSIGSGDAWEEPFDVSDTGAQWAGENEPRPETTPSNVGLLRIPVQEIYALQKVSRKLLDDSQFDIGSYIQGKIIDKFARSEGTAFAVGTGVGQPRGFLNFPVSASDDLTRAPGTLRVYPSLSATSITVDAVKNVYWGLRAVHRSNSTWLMPSAVANILDLAKDGSGQYLWRPGMTSGSTGTLLNRPVEICEDFAAFTAGNICLALGDWSGYTIIDKPGVRYIRDEVTDEPRVLYYMWKRVGGSVSDFDKIRLMKLSLT